MGPITVTLLVVLGALLFMILKKLFERPAAPNPSSNAPPAAPKQDLASLTVADARVGDNISIPGAGDNFSDLDFTVGHSNRYEAGEKQWFDLSGKHGERRVHDRGNAGSPGAPPGFEVGPRSRRRGVVRGGSAGRRRSRGGVLRDHLAGGGESHQDGARAGRANREIPPHHRVALPRRSAG